MPDDGKVAALGGPPINDRATQLCHAGGHRLDKPATAFDRTGCRQGTAPPRQACERLFVTELFKPFGREVDAVIASPCEFLFRRLLKMGMKQSGPVFWTWFGCGHFFETLPQKISTPCNPAT